jgi:GNAT superfamily N-acetyltransferase
MIPVRPATTADAEELVTLRGLMFAAMHGRAPEPGPWQERALATFRRRIADGTLTAFVVEASGGGLAACAVGVIEDHVASPANPLGRTGYVFNVSTRPADRRRGYSRACMQRLLDWYRSEGVGPVELRATKDGETLYASLGFERTAEPSMRLDLTGIAGDGGGAHGFRPGPPGTLDADAGRDR